MRKESDLPISAASSIPGGPSCAPWMRTSLTRPRCCHNFLRQRIVISLRSDPDFFGGEISILCGIAGRPPELQISGTTLCFVPESAITPMDTWQFEGRLSIAFWRWETRSAFGHSIASSIVLLWWRSHARPGSHLLSCLPNMSFVAGERRRSNLRAEYGSSSTNGETLYFWL